MTKADIIEKIQHVTNLSQKDSAAMMESVLTILKESLQAGETIKISGFGRFAVRHKSAYKTRNPKTGEAILIKERRVLTFKPSTRLCKTMNGKLQ